MKILFLCTSNLNRSRTAEDYFRQINPEHQYKSAGLSTKYCKKHNTRLCSVELINWADRVYVMENMHLKRIREYAGEEYLSKLRVLDIPDNFKYGQVELKRLLLTKLADVFNLN